MTDRRFHGLIGHRGHALGDAQTDVIHYRKLRSRSSSIFKKFKKLMERRPAVANVRPDGELGHELRRIFLRWVKLLNQRLIRLDVCDAQLDFARGDMSLQLPKETCINLPTRRSGASFPFMCWRFAGTHALTF